MDSLQPVMTPVTGSLDISICLDESGTLLQVYFGLALVDSIRRSDTLSWKLLAARYYNMGFCQHKLASTLGVSRTSVRRWGAALASDDPERLAKALSGQGAVRKVTEDIKRYVIVSYWRLSGQVRDFAQQIIADVEKVFQVRLSASRLRQIFREERLGMEHLRDDCLVDVLPPGELVQAGADSLLLEPDAEFAGDVEVAVSLDSGTAEAPMEGEADVESSLAEASMAAVAGPKTPPSGAALAMVPVTPVPPAGGTKCGVESVIPSARMLTSRHISFSPWHLCLEDPNSYFCHHAGLMILVPEQARWQDACSPGVRPVLMQDASSPDPQLEVERWLVNCSPRVRPELMRWLAGYSSGQRPDFVRQLSLQILAGAVNYEQSKLVESDSLELLNGPVIRTINYQRKLSDALATVDTLHKLKQCNLAYAKAIAKGYFYFDPHAKDYTGVKHILKGWCGATHDIRKVLYIDAIHTADGTPCYYRHSDNYDDAREHFFAVRDDFVQLLGSPATAQVWIFDRGLYSLETLQQIIELGDGFVTWEKGYQHDGWDDAAETFTFRRTRPRNKREDLRHYCFTYQVKVWEKDPRVTKYIVRASGTDREPIEVSILVANGTLGHEQAIWMMFNRWLQENGFRYQIRHMGLNELTSRAIDAYEDLALTLTDRQVESRQHKQAKRDKTNIEARYGRLLLRRERSGIRLTTTLHKLQEALQQLQDDRETLIQQMTTWRQQLDGLPHDANTSTTSCGLLDQAKQLNRRQQLYEKKQQRYEERSKLEEKLKAAKLELDKIERRLAEIPATESRLKALVEDGYVRFNTARKDFMDAIRLGARNIFYNAIAPFRDAYNNYRDDHVIFRAITRAPGLIRYQNNHLHILLLPSLDINKKQYDAITSVFGHYERQLEALYAKHGHTLKVTFDLRNSRNQYP